MTSPTAYPFDCFMGLAVGSNEVNGIGYARRPATFEDTGEDGVGANAASVQWPACGSNWGLIDTVNLYDAATAGALICTMSATAPVMGNMYDELRVTAATYRVMFAGAVLVPAVFGSPYDVGAYGAGPYEGSTAASVLLFRTFATVALCGNQPGDWIPTPPCEPGVWTPTGACEAGAWAPGPFDVVAS